MPILRDLASNPVGLGQRLDQIADQLRFTDAASVPANYDDSPMIFDSHLE
jgi:hypothetical protein